MENKNKVGKKRKMIYFVVALIAVALAIVVVGLGIVLKMADNKKKEEAAINAEKNEDDIYYYNDVLNGNPDNGIVGDDADENENGKEDDNMSEGEMKETIDTLLNLRFTGIDDEKIDLLKARLSENSFNKLMEELNALNGTSDIFVLDITELVSSCKKIEEDAEAERVKYKDMTFEQWKAAKEKECLDKYMELTGNIDAATDEEWFGVYSDIDWAWMKVNENTYKYQFPERLNKDTLDERVMYNNETGKYTVEVSNSDIENGNLQVQIFGSFPDLTEMVEEQRGLQWSDCIGNELYKLSIEYLEFNYNSDAYYCSISGSAVNGNRNYTDINASVDLSNKVVVNENFLKEIIKRIFSEQGSGRGADYED